ncbi:MAG TPA: pilus assembly protein CpaF, partial [Planctomycetaceae bacterium]|nr:pilus assembly protein CpaF [Planctomycetaceae bacterium]
MATMTEADYDYESNAESKRAFQQLKTRLHRQMIDAMDLSKAGKLPEHELRKQLRALAAHLCDMHSAYLPESEREQMVNEIM